jgi:hypothetical protein
MGALGPAIVYRKVQIRPDIHPDAAAAASREEKSEGCPPLLSVADSNHPIVSLSLISIPPF